MQYRNFRNLIISAITVICVLAPNINAQIRVKLPENPSITTIAPAIRGYNHGDYNFMPWNQVDSDSFRKEFSGLLPGIIRWPGGTGANNYVWQNHLNDETRFHLINCVEFIRDFKIRMQYMVNFGNGSASETANFIRLCNSTDPYWQNNRVSLFGRSEPVNLKICEIGNENNYTHAWVSAWFGRAINEKIYFRNGAYIDFPAFIADSLYFYGGDMRRAGWVEEKTIAVHHNKIEAILGEKYLVKPADNDTITINVSYPKIGSDSIYVWAVDTALTEAELDQMLLQEIYDLITEPRYSLDSNYFTIIGDSAVKVYPPAVMNSGELIYIEYRSVGHEGAFAFRDSIKAVDPTVQVGYSVFPNDSLVNQSYFKHDFVSSPPDFFIIHKYPSTRSMDMLADNNFFSEITYLPQQIVQHYIIPAQAYIDSVVSESGLSQRLGIAITEWSYANAECHECNMSIFDGILGAVNSAMFAASLYEAMHNSSLNLITSNFQLLITKWNNLSIYKVTPGLLQFNITSRAHAMRLLNNTIGTIFFSIDSTDITGNSMIDILTKNFDGSIETIAIPSVKMWGGIDSLYNDYSLLLINQDDSQEHSLTFQVPSAWSVDSVSFEIMTGLPDTSIYFIEHKILPIINDSLQIMLPALSLAGLRFTSPGTGVETNSLITKAYSLNNAYPNPFNSSTRIGYDLPERADVSIKIFDVLGRKVRTLVHKNQTAGYHFVQWDGKNDENQNVSSGIYFYQFKAGDKFLKTKKLLFLK